MSTNGDEEETGPSTDSADPQERVEARRLRIARRVEARKRQEMGVDPDAKKDVKEELSKSRKQIEESRQRLTKLKTDGTELVTNVEVAGDSRESQRRLEEEELRRQRTERLEAEAKASAEKFEDVTKKWDSARRYQIPQDLHELLMQQRAACDQMIDEKNKLVNDLQQELKTKDDQYVKDLKKQAEDVDLMIERMEEQIKNLTKSYREELTQIDKAFEAERGELLEGNRKKWNQTMQTRTEKEVEYLKLREKRVEEYEQQLQHLRVQDAEEYNMVKIKLETDVQILEQQLQQMRATYQLNQEKLEYNFQVLKKRDEENTITKSQQKRKITRLQDVLNNLKVKLAKQEKQYKEENQGLTDDYKRITEQYQELQKKFKHFQSTDSRKFREIWMMNEAEAKDLVHRVLEADRIIHEQQLGLPFYQPDLWFMENEGPIVPRQMQGAKLSAMEVVQKVMSDQGVGPGGAVIDEEEEIQEEGETMSMAGSQGSLASDKEQAEPQETTVMAKLTPGTIKQILELLCDESGFLVESKLNKLLAPLERDERSLMKLDAIFGALAIETEDDVHLLAQYFVKPKAAPVPQDAESAGPTPAPTERTDQPTSEAGEEGEEGSFIGSEEEELQFMMEEKESVKTTKSEVPELIHPNDIFKALRTFVNEHRQQQKKERRASSMKFVLGEERDDSQDEGYWRAMGGIIPEKKERLWSALLEGFDKYSRTLDERAKLITDTDALRQQNAELRMLLHQYVNSKVNGELEIPPTKVLQLEFSENQQQTA
ncbi:dynein regulatory complex protein 1-like [Branchiostoma floridae]|uniref:Dynein regulatory complex protein 1 n=1 Tax=Branchiostoma floridae TaxID=7739 RepID=A0A9J7N3T2_BRAFL|nr:dynein regulatory complex protein 1-like [Branchiostoma floridae]